MCFLLLNIYLLHRETAPLLLLRCRPGPLPGRLSPVGWVIGQQPTERPNCIQFQQVTATPLNLFEFILNTTGWSCHGSYFEHCLELWQTSATPPRLWRAGH